MDKMEYLTSLLRFLILQSASRVVASRQTYKLLNRTHTFTDCLLSDWLILVLYGWYHDTSGPPLFLLVNALKQLVDKGPVDAITQDAYYSLSEEKLLYTNCEYKTIVSLQNYNPS